MKWIAVSLLVLNVAYLAWSQLRYGPDSEEEPVTKEQVFGEEVVAEDYAADPVDSEPYESSNVENEPSIPGDRAFSCYVAGAFSNRAMADSYVAKVRRLGMSATVVARPAMATQFRVQTRAFESREEFVRYRKLLALAQFDGKLIKDGRGRYALSLGVFSREVDASQLFSRLRQSGFSSIQLAEVESTLSDYEIKVSNVLDDNPETTRRLLSEAASPLSLTSLEKISCK